MELDEAEQAAFGGGSSIGPSGMGASNDDSPRSAADIWEFQVHSQYGNLLKFARENDCLLSGRLNHLVQESHVGMEHVAFREPITGRIWKSTFPDQAGFGPAGYSTPIGYFRRLRLSNRVFGDDVRFEGIWKRPEGLSILTSQRYIFPDPETGMPTEAEISNWMKALGFEWSDEHSGFIRETDEVLVQDTHRRNYIRAIDGEIYAIDVQPRLPKGREIEDAIPFNEAIKS
ncbi:MAG: hypothetical protein P1U58_06295 [Verrucomicrobiales bacterium]|nr:hypothetical protein [Verrucomicrobiales bacterium]